MPPSFDDTAAQRPRLLLCGPARDGGAAGALLADLEARDWSPPGALLSILSLSGPVARAAETAAEAVLVERASGVLILDTAPKSAEWRVEMRAVNRGGPKGGRISPLGPASVRTGAPVVELVRAIQQSGAPASASSDPGEGMGAWLFYRLLSEAGDAGPTVVLLHAPAVAADAAPVEDVATALSARLVRGLSPA
ncbi:MAG TPA: hypothetical protein VD929_09110 [Caulobacteraceae bacterium]|nr:hypothetical protein [Caulobacteraceae bacterium]